MKSIILAICLIAFSRYALTQSTLDESGYIIRLNKEYFDSTKSLLKCGATYKYFYSNTLSFSLDTAINRGNDLNYLDNLSRLIQQIELQGARTINLCESGTMYESCIDSMNVHDIHYINPQIVPNSSYLTEVFQIGAYNYKVEIAPVEIVGFTCNSFKGCSSNLPSKELIVISELTILNANNKLNIQIFVSKIYDYLIAFD